MNRPGLSPCDAAGTEMRRLRRKLTRLLCARGARFGWDLTLTALAYQAQYQRDPNLSLNDFATRHGADSSALYQNTRGHNLVFWHGTSLERAEKICQHGFAHFKGVWMDQATRVPFSFARSRAQRHEARPAILVSVIDTDRFTEEVDYRWETNRHIVVFQHDVPSDVVQYLVTDETFCFVGAESCRGCRPTRRARFTRRGGQWVTPGTNAAYFDRDRQYRSLAEWLDLLAGDLLRRHGPLYAIEIFSAIYANVSPTDAVSRRDVIEAIVRQRPTAKLRGSDLLLSANAD